MFFEPYPNGEMEPVSSRGPTPMRIPASEALGPGRDAKIVEIAKDVMPTIALHVIRLPKDGRHEMPKNTINNIYAVSSGKVRITAEGFSEVLGVGDVAAMPCWHAHAIEATEDCVMLRVSDEPLMTKVGLLRTAG
jgi:gentisate 1,2-dioxygenase